MALQIRQLAANIGWILFLLNFSRVLGQLGIPNNLICTDDFCDVSIGQLGCNPHVDKQLNLLIAC